MEALGGSPVREAPLPGWGEAAAHSRSSGAQASLENPESAKPKGRLRRLANLNPVKLISDGFFIIETCTVAVLAALAGVASLSLDSLKDPQAAAFLMAPVGAAALLKARGLYEFDQLAAFLRPITQVLLCVGLVICAAGLIGYALNGARAFSGTWFAAWLLLTLVAVTALRAAGSWLCSWLIRCGAIHQAVAVFGDAAAAQGAVKALAKTGRFLQPANVFGAHGQSGVEALIEGARRRDFETVVIATDTPSSRETTQLLARLESLPCDVQICLALKRDEPGRCAPAFALAHVQAQPIGGWGLVCKRSVDVCLAAAGLVFLAPLLLLAAAAIKLDSPGPVLFAQRRNGLNREIFQIFKLRTMSVMEDGAEAVQAARQDARVTRVGGFLRKTSIDELPQLLNVLKGDMSLVGPRPHPLSLDHQYEDQIHTYGHRHKVKPGITGWAQIHGHRGPTDKPGLMQRRVQHDLEYIDNWSFWLDIKILAATPFLGIIHKNAV